MNTRIRPARLSLLKRCSLTLAASSFALVASAAAVPNATPADLYQDMESGKAGDLLTPELATASSHGEGAAWSIHGNFWVSTEKPRALPGPVVVGGKTFAGTEATRTWMFKDSNARNFVQYNLKGRITKVTVACFYTPCVTVPVYNNFDTIVLHGYPAYAVLQTRNETGKQLNLRGHSCGERGETTVSPTEIPVVSGKTYWVNLHFDGEAGKAFVAAFDPDKNFAQVGETVVAQSRASTMSLVALGRYDNHGDNPNATTQSYFGQILVDYTNGAFPLLPQTASRPSSVPAPQSQNEKAAP